jgi:hypothetical protein
MARIEELKALAADLRKRLKQVDQLTGRASERDRDAQRKRDARATAKEVQIPLCEDPQHRDRPPAHYGEQEQHLTTQDGATAALQQCFDCTPSKVVEFLRAWRGGGINERAMFAGNRRPCHNRLVF